MISNVAMVITDALDIIIIVGLGYWTELLAWCVLENVDVSSIK